MICGFSEYFNDYTIFDRFYTIVDPTKKNGICIKLKFLILPRNAGSNFGWINIQ